MNRKRPWNSHQRHKFLRPEASRDILKFRVSEMAFPGGFRDRSFDDFRDRYPHFPSKFEWSPPLNPFKVFSDPLFWVLSYD